MLTYADKNGWVNNDGRSLQAHIVRGGRAVRGVDDCVTGSQRSERRRAEPLSPSTPRAPDLCTGWSGAFGRMQDMVEQSIWMQKVAADPGHSQWYVERFRTMEREGKDVVGEARFVDAMAARGSRILDAGCGAGRIAGYLATVGHDVVGVDVDPVLIAAAEKDHPGPRWLVNDLAELDLPSRGIDEPFDIIVSAGNVMTFLAPSTRVTVLSRLRAHLRDDGRAVIGFGAGRDYPFDEFLNDAKAAGFESDVLLAAWDIRPFTERSEFLVAVLRDRTR